MKHRNPSQDRLLVDINSPINFNASLKKPKKIKEPKTEKNKSSKIFLFDEELSKKEETLDDKKFHSKERIQPRRFSIQGFKSSDIVKPGKSNIIDFKFTKIDSKAPSDDFQKDSTNRKAMKKIQDLNKSSKIDKKTNEFTKTINRTNTAQEKQKKIVTEKQNRKVQDEVREKITVEAIEKLKKLSNGKKPKAKVKSSKDKSIHFNCIKKKKKKVEEVKNRIDPSPKFIKNLEISKRIKENRAVIIIQRWYREILKRHNSEISESEEESFYSSGLATEREEWVNFLDSKYCGTNSAFVEEFKAQIQINKVQIKKLQADNESTAKSHKTSSNSESFESTLIVDPTKIRSNLNPEKKLNIPKLSLTMLKGNEFSSDEDDHQSQYEHDSQIIKNQNFQNSFLNESDSFSSVQLIESKAIRKPAVSKKVPNMKSLDLGKVKTYSESSDECSEAQDFPNHQIDFYKSITEKIEVQGKPQNQRKFDQNLEDSDFVSIESDEWSQDNQDYDYRTSLNAESNKKYMGYKEVETNLKKVYFEKEKEAMPFALEKNALSTGNADIKVITEMKKIQSNDGQEKFVINGKIKQNKNKEIKIESNQISPLLFENKITGKMKDEELSKTSYMNKGSLVEGVKKLSHEPVFKILKDQAPPVSITEELSFIESSLADSKSLQNSETQIELNYSKKLEESKDEIGFKQKIEKKDLNEETNIDFQTKVEGFNINSKNSVQMQEVDSKFSFKSPQNLKPQKEQDLYSEKSIKYQDKNEILDNFGESKITAVQNSISSNINPKLEIMNSSSTKVNPKVSQPNLNVLEQNPKEFQSISKDEKDFTRETKSSVNLNKSNQIENKFKHTIHDPDTIKVTSMPDQLKTATVSKEVQESIINPKLIQKETKTTPFVSKPLFTSIDSTKTSKVVASYQISHLQIPAKDISSNDKSFELSPCDFLQTSIIHPSDFQSPPLSNRSDLSDKSSKAALSKRSESHSPQQSPRLADPISSFASKQLTKKEEKPSHNKNLFNSKLFENNSEPLSERAKNFIQTSHVLSKANELKSDNFSVEKSEQTRLESQMPGSLLTAHQKQDIPEKELKMIKSPRQNANSDLFKSLNPDTSSSSDELSPRMMSRESNSIKSEEIPEILQKLIYSEIYSFLRLIPFKKTEREVDSSIEFMIDYLEVMSKELKQNEEEVLDAINTPAYQEPINKLAIVQDFSTVLSKFPTLELILPPDLCSELKVYFHSLELPSRQIYLQMLFDCVNEALNYIRPFGVDGIPDPWSSKPRILFGEAELSNVFTRIISYMIKWASCKAGLFHCHETRRDEERLLYLREEKMSALLCLDVRDEEDNWLRYEEEETQIKIMTSNNLLQLLLDEIINIIN